MAGLFTMMGIRRYSRRATGVVLAPFSAAVAWKATALGTIQVGTAEAGSSAEGRRAREALKLNAQQRVVAASGQSQLQMGDNLTKLNTCEM